MQNDLLSPNWCLFVKRVSKQKRERIKLSLVDVAKVFDKIQLSLEISQFLLKVWLDTYSIILKKIREKQRKGISTPMDVYCF